MAQALKLQEQVRGELFIDDGNHGAAWNHARVLEKFRGTDGHLVVLEDDAIVCKNFLENAKNWIERFPNRLISFYLGTGRPPQWQPLIAELLSTDPEYIELNQLIHAVAYAIPCEMIPKINGTQADFALGNAWRLKQHTPIIYTVPSLVDHTDLETIEIHPDGQPRNEVRKAWRFLG